MSMTNSDRRKLFEEIYLRLLNEFGFMHWWPGETKEEIVIGAILTQSVSWANVEKAIANNVLIIPGNVFSEKDTHFRISYATSDTKIKEGIEILHSLT